MFNGGNVKTCIIFSRNCNKAFDLFKISGKYQDKYSVNAL